MITSDQYGRTPYRTFKHLNRAGVTPSEWMDILDAYYDITSGDPDFDQVERWIKANTVDGKYVAPSPLNQHAVVSA